MLCSSPVHCRNCIDVCRSCADGKITSAWGSPEVCVLPERNCSHSRLGLFLSSHFYWLQISAPLGKLTLAEITPEVQMIFYFNFLFSYLINIVASLLGTEKCEDKKLCVYLFALFFFSNVPISHTILRTLLLHYFPKGLYMDSTYT